MAASALATVAPKRDGVGCLAGDWRQTTLGDLADYVNGYAFKPTDWHEEGLPIIRIAQLTDSSDCDRYPGRLPDKYLLNNGDLVFSWSATLMTMMWNRGPACLNQHLFKVVPKSGTDLQFLHHLLDFNMDALAAQSHGTTMKHIKRSDLLPFPVFVPAEREQRLIAAVLDAVDTTIAKTEQLVVKHQRLRRGLMHVLLTLGVDETGKLRDRRADRFSDTSLGALPRDWTSRRLADVTDKIVDGVHSTPTYVDEGPMFLTVENLTRTTGVSISPCRRISDDAHRAYTVRADPQPGDVLVSKDGTLGVARVVPDHLSNFSIFVSIALLRPKRALVMPELIAAFFDSDFYREQIGRQSAGTGLKHIVLNQFRDFVLPIPPLVEQERIFVILAAAERQLSALRAEASKLVNLRDGLRSDLLTGRVRVARLREHAP